MSFLKYLEEKSGDGISIYCGEARSGLTSLSFELANYYAENKKSFIL